jgi:peptidoglycan/LPS O-acetylase OafA/YrhL
LRALAALGVLVGHAWGWSHGYDPAAIYGTYHARLFLSGGFGVFLFFALSGYLLYLPFARGAFGDRGNVELGRYAANRALRILPLYYVVMAVYLALASHAVQTQWWRFALFLQNFSADTVNKVDPPAWSLIVEVQFYILLPLFAWLVAKTARRSLGTATAIVATLGVVAFLVRFATVTHAHETTVWRYSLPATCVFFFPGFLLAHLRVHLDKRQSRWTTQPVIGSSNIWFVAGIGAWLVVAYRYNLDIAMLTSSALLLGACALPLRQGSIVKLLDGRVIAGLGAASYSLYLWHGPIIERLSKQSWMPDGFLPLLVVGLLVCCTIALVSYRLIESPFLKLRRSWSSSRLPADPAIVLFPQVPVMGAPAVEQTT